MLKARLDKSLLHTCSASKITVLVMLFHLGRKKECCKQKRTSWIGWRVVRSRNGHSDGCVREYLLYILRKINVRRTREWSRSGLRCKAGTCCSGLLCWREGWEASNVSEWSWGAVSAIFPGYNPRRNDGTDVERIVMSIAGLGILAATVVCCIVEEKSWRTPREDVRHLIWENGGACYNEIN